jgi:hypothetical protein
MPASPRREHWKSEPEDHDYPAALAYLTLVVQPDAAAQVVERLRAAELQRFKARDLVRASRLKLLPASNLHVAADLKKVRRGQRLSPVLLVRGQLSHDVPLTVADGYHRICASYVLDQDADIPCRLVDVAEARRPRAR